MHAPSGWVHYHDPNELHPTIRIDADGIPGNRIDPPLVRRTVLLHDVRHHPAPRFESDGVVFLRAPGPLESLDRPEARARYDRALESLLAEHLSVREAVVFDHTERRDDAGLRPPARHVHGDYTVESGAQRFVDVLGPARAAAWQRGRAGIVNVWRPLLPVERAPLAFALPATVRTTDWVDIAIVYPDRQGRITGLLPSPDHRWVFQSAMTPDDVVVFRTYDNQGAPVVPHTAIDLVDAPAGPPRQSRETRILVRYA